MIKDLLKKWPLVGGAEIEDYYFNRITTDSAGKPMYDLKIYKDEVTCKDIKNSMTFTYRDLSGGQAMEALKGELREHFNDNIAIEACYLLKSFNNNVIAAITYMLEK